MLDDRLFGIRWIFISLAMMTLLTPSEVVGDSAVDCEEAVGQVEAYADYIREQHRKQYKKMRFVYDPSQDYKELRCTSCSKMNRDCRRICKKHLETIYNSYVRETNRLGKLFTELVQACTTIDTTFYPGFSRIKEYSRRTHSGTLLDLWQLAQEANEAVIIKVIKDELPRLKQVIAQAAGSGEQKEKVLVEIPSQDRIIIPKTPRGHTPRE